MPTKSLTWDPFLALLMRELKRSLKIFYQSIATPLISTALYLLIFGVSIGKEIGKIHHATYLAFLIPGLMMMTTLRNSFENSMGSVVVMRFCGELEELRMLPISPMQIAWGNGLGGLFRGLVVGYLTLLVGLVFYWLTYGEFLVVKHPFITLFFLTIGGLSFAHLGLAISMYSVNFEQINAINTFILLPLIYLGGIFFSLEQLHPFWQQLSKLNPLLYMVNGIRYGILGFSDVNLYAAFFVSLFAFAILHLIAIRSLQKGYYSRW